MLVGLAFMIAIAFQIISLDQLSEFRHRQESESVKDIALKLQKELLLAATVEDGYVRSFEIPDKIIRKNYTITTLNTTLTVESDRSVYVVAIPQSFGNMTTGVNSINKAGGVININ
jgi:hypothetical protein